MAVFDVNEIYRFAVRIEENGEKFYRRAAEKMEDPEVKAAFEYLADEEVRHRTLFDKLQSKLGDYEPAESYVGEYAAYLGAYADNIVFIASTDEELETMISRVEDAVSAVDFAIKRELESVAYYEGMKRFTPTHQHVSLDRIVDEERGHFLKLSELKRTAKAN